MEIKSSLCKGGALTFFTFIVLFHIETPQELFWNNYDVVGKKKAWVLLVSTIQERDKKNAEYCTGDYS